MTHFFLLFLLGGTASGPCSAALAGALATTVTSSKLSGSTTASTRPGVGEYRCENLTKQRVVDQDRVEALVDENVVAIHDDQALVLKRDKRDVMNVMVLVPSWHSDMASLLMLCSSPRASAQMQYDFCLLSRRIKSSA